MEPVERRPDEARLGQFLIHVSVRQESVGPIAVSVGHVRTRERYGRQSLSAKLLFRNDARRTASMTDRYRHSRFAKGGTGDQLLVMDEGCGWGIEDRGDPIEPGLCQTYLDRIEMAPGRTADREIAAVKGLAGMAPLSAGTYTFRRRVKFRFEGKRLDPVAADLRVVFEVTRVPG